MAVSKTTTKTVQSLRSWKSNEIIVRPAPMFRHKRFSRPLPVPRSNGPAKHINDVGRSMIDLFVLQKPIKKELDPGGRIDWA